MTQYEGRNIAVYQPRIKNKHGPLYDYMKSLAIWRQQMKNNVHTLRTRAPSNDRNPCRLPVMETFLKKTVGSNTEVDELQIII
jgi:hypothetical protein